MSGMARRDVPLNPKQLQILEWVRDGCADGIYDDWSHRIIARALHNRGLITVAGSGARWSATLTEDGAHYLDHGTYPEPAEPLVSPKKLSVADEAPSGRKQGTAAPVRTKSNRSESPKRPGLIEQYVGMLAEAGSQGIRVPYADKWLHRKRAVKANRDGRIPAGMQFSFRRKRAGDQDELWIALVKVPAWQAAVLSSVRQRRIGLERTDVVQSLSESDTFSVTNGPRERALRLLDALVTGAREEGMTVTGSTGQLINHRSPLPPHEEIVFAGEAGAVRLWLTQAILQLPHEPTERELKKARQGYLFPDHDDVPDEHLSITLDGRSGDFWGNAWSDTDEHRLEEDLGQVLEEIRFRHEAQAATRDFELLWREAKQRQLEEAQREWDLVRNRAITRFKEQFLIDTMLVQAKQWTQVSELRRFAEAIRGGAAQFNDERRVRAIDWAEQIEKQSDAIDPLQKPAGPPAIIPEPSREDLKPYMGSRGWFRP